MTEQLWGIGGVVAGITATGISGWLRDRSKAKRDDAAARRPANQKLCEEFLASVEQEVKGAIGFEEQNGVMRSDAGYEESPATARSRLTEVELHCPPGICSKALNLVESLEAWLWRGRAFDAYSSARTDFIDAFRRLL